MGKITLILLGTCIFSIFLGLLRIIEPGGTFTGLLIGCSGGAALFITGPMWLAKKAYANMTADANAQVSSSPSVEVTAMTDIQVIEYLDTAFNKVVGVANHPWLAQHWHKLDAAEKVKWVNERREHLNVELSSARAPMQFVNALQQADRKYTVKAS